mgnify:CR=1 FL=1
MSTKEMTGMPSQQEVEASQIKIMQEQMGMQLSMQLEAEERAAGRRAAEKASELERRRVAELERAEQIRAEEMREQTIMGEAAVEGAAAEYGDLNLDVPLIEQPDYAEPTELE